MAEVMLESEAMVAPQAQQRDIKLSFPRFDAPHVVHADRTRVKQVLLNLLTNAIKYNHEHGTVGVSCTAAGRDRVRVSIRDSGAGLTPDEIAQLFQPFNRLGQEAGAEEGTGIGLVVAKRLIELMGGTIGVESTPGVGSEFWFELQTESGEQRQLEAALAEPAAGPTVRRDTGPCTVLYVEDNPANLKLVEQIIGRNPKMRLLTAVNGADGIQVARRVLPDVILMDINLPGIDGFEALRLLRMDPATVDIPVIAVSANAMPLDVEKGLRAGFCLYLTKPIRVDELLNALDVTMERVRKTRAEPAPPAS